MKLKFTFLIVAFAFITMTSAQYNSNFDMANFLKGKWSNYAYSNGWVGYNEYPDSLERKAIFYPLDSANMFSYCEYEMTYLIRQNDYELKFSYNLSFSDSSWVFYRDDNGYELNLIIDVWHNDSVTLNQDAISDGGPDYFSRLDNLTYTTCEPRIDTISLPTPISELGIISSIAPNPSNDFVEIQLKDNQIGIVSVYNSHGQIMLESITSKSGWTKLDLSPFANGLYFVRIVNQSNQSVVKKITKN